MNNEIEICLDLNEALDLIDDIEQYRMEKLTDWELKFIDDISRSFYPQLTEKQTKKLNQIYDRVMK